jgi:redox-sensitive bicupin YhaK (pirin superfamily)
MIIRRRAAERGHVNLGWLDTWHTFSFGDYYDPRHMGWSVLRVINQDRVAGLRGFGMHPHRNMEILTVMLEGQLTHCDSMGHQETLRADECQLMSAGRGVLHSEMNDAPGAASLLQIWLLPAVANTEPGYQQKHFPFKTGMTLIASPDGRDDSLVLRQQACIWRVRSPAGEALRLPLSQGKHAWLQVISGSVSVGGELHAAGDALGVKDETALALETLQDADLLYFDLP